MKLALSGRDSSEKPEARGLLRADEPLETRGKLVADSPAAAKIIQNSIFKILLVSILNIKS